MTNPDGTHAEREGGATALTLPALLIAVFIVPISVAGAATALPAIARDLGSDPTALQWVVNGFNVTFAIFTLVWGAVSDRIGYKPTFLIGTIGTIVASAVSAMATSLLWLDFSRLLAGAFCAAIGISVTAIVSGAYRGAARVRGFALFGTMLGAGLALGPTIAGLLTATFGWEGVFVAFGAVLLIPLALSRSVPALRYERELNARVLDVRLLRNLGFLSIVMVPVVQAFGYISLLTYLPVALSSVYGLDPGATGLMMLAMTGPVLFGPVLGTRLVASLPRVSIYTIIYASIVLMFLGNIGMLVLLAAGTPLATLVVPMMLLGFSFGLPLGLVDGAAMAAVPPHVTGSAAGILNFLRLGSEAFVVAAYATTVGAFIGSRIADPTIAQEVAAGLPGHADAYVPAFVVGQIAILFAVLIGLVLTIILHRASLSTSPPATETESPAMTTLFEPVRLGNLQLPNRIAMAPMTRNRAGAAGVPVAINAEYYAQRASAGLIITEGTQPSLAGQGYFDTPGIHSEEQVEGWRAVADAVHAAGGRLFVQLMHAGRLAHPENKNDVETVAPSAIAAAGEIYTPTGVKAFPIPRALAEDEISAVIAEYVHAARRAITAGVDGVEIHGANGYLVHQFLAPNTNDRVDRYGGSAEARARFAIEVVTAVAEAVGAHRVGLRISPASNIQDAIEEDPEQTARTYGALVDAVAPLGIAYLSYLADPRSELIRDLVTRFGGVTIANDGFAEVTSLESSSAIIEEGLADLVAVGRPLIANPDLVARWRSGAALNEADAATFYGGDATGYTDYPVLAG